jgi:prepilin-type N-terminal cleavage/methylation domain-containing protein
VTIESPPPSGKSVKEAMSPFKMQCERGLTLLELLMVMVIIAMVIGIGLPRLPDIAGLSIDRDARKVSRMLQLVRSRAVSLRRYYKVDLDFERSTMNASYFGPEGTYIEDEQINYLEIDEPVMLKDLVTAARGKVISGTGEIHISPRGFIEPSVIHLVDDSERVFSVIPEVLSGEVNLLDEYVELSGG